MTKNFFLFLLLILFFSFAAYSLYSYRDIDGKSMKNSVSQAVSEEEVAQDLFERVETMGLTDSQTGDEVTKTEELFQRTQEQQLSGQ